MKTEPVKYQVEEYSACIEELKQIYPEHYEELGVTKEFKLEPNYEVYNQMNTSKLLHTITVRDNGILVGYILALVLPALHYKSCITCIEDIYYLKKEYRKGRIGINLFKFFEDYMKNLGVHRIVLSTKVHLDNSKLFEYLGYSFVEKLYAKRLGD